MNETPGAPGADRAAWPPDPADAAACLLRIRNLGRCEYRQTWQAMVDFTLARTAETDDEIWCCEHPPVFTLGQAGRPEHLLADIGIPLVRTDRGGQITYHGPGQVVIYLLLDLNRRRLKVREVVTLIEQSVIEFLAGHGIAAQRRTAAPGVYVGSAKIAALGLRVRRACCYHGLSLNVDMDLAPFAAINPCGYPGLQVTQTSDLGLALTPRQASAALVEQLARQLEGRS
ncbi:MAG TPA: lipoyl(octanoyl) transferase LipB [Accumulibacter sp.]|uniref:lipoyl(octanoyl) transferase LipB n=1 Tax=Accumulibacter sp. TaxID=2053492 RepID=UPI0026324E67|nr:lipoyl(octanoyl) transferase LipB [Accumulibacter sp.]MDS4055795.1 lipoyl(octanoyl) transferase LipB [Accumulibacter sp.]HMV06801.1 lipoyl(octanoyl) transferase LipB [Accumulibacter sp.]HMW62260.1 lipoyl(octanoyl) transferase LipB [Accumulibacter sp.]HMW79331.1 lipoyl(octanoyl) transferase LipB [Accumulibacter sp.]HMX69941.1 lipoyl(octanoyl) transferase LipB [Accumulibacter sp.]